MGVVRLLLGKMVMNRDQKLEPIMEVIRRNFFFIQQSIAASRVVLATVTGYLLQFELITRQNHDNTLTPSGRGLVDILEQYARSLHITPLRMPKYEAVLAWPGMSWL